MISAVSAGFSSNGEWPTPGILTMSRRLGKVSDGDERHPAHAGGSDLAHAKAVLRFWAMRVARSLI